MSFDDKLGKFLLIALTGFALLMLIVPSAIIVAISFTEKAYIGFPPSGFSLKWYSELLDKQQLIDSAVTSLWIAFVTTVLSILIGIPAAFSLVRGRFLGRSEVTAFVVAPQMLPGMVIGIALLFFGAYFGIYQSNTPSSTNLTPDGAYVSSGTATLADGNIKIGIAINDRLKKASNK